MWVEQTPGNERTVVSVQCDHRSGDGFTVDSTDCAFEDPRMAAEKGKGLARSQIGSGNSDSIDGNASLAELLRTFNGVHYVGYWTVLDNENTIDNEEQVARPGTRVASVQRDCLKPSRLGVSRLCLDWWESL